MPISLNWWRQTCAAASVASPDNNHKINYILFCFWLCIIHRFANLTIKPNFSLFYVCGFLCKFTIMLYLNMTSISVFQLKILSLWWLLHMTISLIYKWRQHQEMQLMQFICMTFAIYIICVWRFERNATFGFMCDLCGNQGRSLLGKQTENRRTNIGNLGGLLLVCRFSISPACNPLSSAQPAYTAQSPWLCH